MHRSITASRTHVLWHVLYSLYHAHEFYDTYRSITLYHAHACACVYIYIHTHTHTLSLSLFLSLFLSLSLFLAHTSKYSYKRMKENAYIPINICMHTFLQTYVCIHSYKHMYAYTPINICMRTFLQTYVCIRIYSYKHMHANADINTFYSQRTHSIVREHIL